jgi:hypothetical protein
MAKEGRGGNNDNGGVRLAKIPMNCKKGAHRYFVFLLWTPLDSSSPLEKLSSRSKQFFKV